MRTLAIIPARYASTRFPGKPLALVHGTPMIACVWRGVTALPAVDHAVVATDDERIYQAVKAFGGDVVMTSPLHASGTDRCGEVLSRWHEPVDIVINVQGDEPNVHASQLQSLIDAFADPDVSVATLRKRIETTEELLSPNVVKVVTDARNRALYFSRQPLPHLRGVPTSEWLQRPPYYKHVGIYAFRSAVLSRLVALPQAPTERAESLEQLRWLHNGTPITVLDTCLDNVGIDTPDDLHRLNSKYSTL